MARLLTKPLEGPWDYEGPFNEEQNKKERDALDKLQDAGELYYEPIADGRAFYKIVKRKPLTLQHVPVGDAYRLPEPHIRGLRLSDIEQYFGRMDMLEKLFNKRA